MAPLVTSHDIKMLSLGEVFVILSVSRVGQAILVFFCITRVSIIEIGLSPVSIVGILLTVSPVTTEVHVQTQILKAVYLIVNFHITQII